MIRQSPDMPWQNLCLISVLSSTTSRLGLLSTSLWWYPTFVSRESNGRLPLVIQDQIRSLFHFRSFSRMPHSINWIQSNRQSLRIGWRPSHPQIKRCHSHLQLSCCCCGLFGDLKPAWYSYCNHILNHPISRYHGLYRFIIAKLLIQSYSI